MAYWVGDHRKYGFTPLRVITGFMAHNERSDEHRASAWAPAYPMNAGCATVGHFAQGGTALAQHFAHFAGTQATVT